MSAFTWQRAVIKVGSSLIAPDGLRCSGKYLLQLARFINASREAGKEIILVSSGSVAAGREKIPVHHVASIAEKQAMAAIGQVYMMANWQRFFDFPCAQMLITVDDLHDRTRYVNISNTLRQLLDHKALPIVNENDTVAVKGLKVGDNDNLAAYTALVASADTLIICSDVDGLYDGDPRKNSDAKLIPKVAAITPEIYALAGGAGSAVGTGGMRTKIQAADKCSQSGIQTLIVNGKDSTVFDKMLASKSPGTLFVAHNSSKTARSLWLEHTLKSRGRITVDKGACKAITTKGASLLPVGVTKVNGQFKNGEAVDIYYEDTAIAKGISLYSAAELRQIIGLKSDKIRDVLGYEYGEVIIHRDDLVVFDQ